MKCNGTVSDFSVCLTLQCVVHREQDQCKLYSMSRSQRTVCLVSHILQSFELMFLKQQCSVVNLFKIESYSEATCHISQSLDNQKKWSDSIWRAKSLSSVLTSEYKIPDTTYEDLLAYLFSCFEYDRTMCSNPGLC